MDFNRAIERINNVLYKQEISLDLDNYDGVIVKQLKSSNTLDSGRRTNQTHIAITGQQMDIFPTIENVGYHGSDKPNVDLKKYFLGKIDVYLSENNIKYLSDDLNYSAKDTFVKSDTIVIKSVRSDMTKQIQLSILDKDDCKFVGFRKYLHKNFVLIVLKRKESLEYEFYGLKPEDFNEEIKELNNSFFYLTTNTVVNISEAALSNDKLDKTSGLKYNSNLETKFNRNRIIFGAPGTGKSNKLNEDKDALMKNGGEFERVTFHPDYSYANFVGVYKPVPSNETKEKKSISYEFVPGPFMRMYVKAIKNCISDSEEPKPYLLIIEEINRANTAAVFGDVFQLLDRKNNISEYPIQISEDVKKYLSEQEELSDIQINELRIPDNMFIWASMNSADQGVFPIDTAFKRRWSFEYLGIDANEEKIDKYYVDINGDEIHWNSLRKAINNYLSNNGVNEDKLLGPFFINIKLLQEKTSSLESGRPSLNKESFANVFKNKVLMYLFEDAARQRPSLFDGCEDNIKKRFSKICESFDSKGVYIFDKSIVEETIKGSK